MSTSEFHTSRFIKVGKIGQVVAGLEHGRVHQWRQGRVVALVEGLGRDLDRL